MAEGDAPLLLEAPGRRWHHDSADAELVDALPYVDQDYADPRLKIEVERLIDEEMSRVGKRPGHFLVELPPLPASELEGCPMVAKALERVRAGKPPLAFEAPRCSVEAPAVGKRNDLYAWMSALDNAKTQLEYQTMRTENLDMLLKHGSNAWRVHNQHLEALSVKLQASARKLKAEIEALNRERKLNQQAAASVLNHLSAQWKDLCQKNSDIESACERVEEELRTLRPRV